MPNPKSGTVVPGEDLSRTIREVRGGRVEFRNDKTGLLHVGVGKVSFSEQQITENISGLDGSRQRHQTVINQRHLCTFSNLYQHHGTWHPR
jgi:ribosomal protein L1